MRVLMLMAAFAAGCGSDSAVGPDEKKLNSFDEFSVWGSGMEDHSAPTSAGDDADADSDADSDADADADADADTDADADADDTGMPSSGSGACMNPDWTDCLDTDEASCSAMGWLYYGDYTCADFLGGGK